VLEKTYFTLLSFILFKVCIDSLREFHLGTSSLYILCFNHINLPIAYSFSITMLALLFNAYSAFCYIICWVDSVLFIL
jgi:hypothetical protein